MEIKLLKLEEGARKASGLTIVIDVFRAFTTACYVIGNGANFIIPVASVEEALHLKTIDKEIVLLGERNERKCPGFDFGNSPSHIQHINFRHKTIVQTTSAGTRGLLQASHAEELLTGSFVNANAIVRYIQMRKPAVVSLVAMGYNAERESQEDNYCAEYIKNKLEGKEMTLEPIIEMLRYGDGARLLDPANHEHSPASDFDLCLELDKFNFILKANTLANGTIKLNRFDV